MNKTVTVNLGGIVFHIDEDAYEILKNYLDTIRMHFGKTEGASEIMSDIESRFGELFSEKIAGGRQVIQKPDVDEAIKIMGNPEDIAESAGAEKGDHSYSTHTGGKRKRFYRNPDDKVIGGVCGGIATYFDFDPLWLRLAFAVSFFFFGSGFLLYIILLIIIPKAKTTAEKLEMRGEPVNIPNIEKSIKEEFEQFKEKFNDFKTEAKQYSKKDVKGGLRNFFDELGEFLSQVFGMFFKVVGKIFAVIFVIIGVIVVSSLTAGLLASMGILHNSSVFHINVFDSGTNSFSDFSGLIFSSDSHRNLSILAFCILVGIPFLRLMISGIKTLLNIKKGSPVLNIILTAVWAIGLILGIVEAINLGNEFARESEVKETIHLMQPAGNVLYLDAVNKDEEFEPLDEFTPHFHNVSLRIVRAEGTEFELLKSSVSRGKSVKEAVENAQKISFSLMQKDSLVSINPVITLGTGEKFRNQRIRLLLKVPEGKSVHFSYDLEDMLRQAKNENGKRTDEMLGHTFEMGNKKLVCTDCGN